MQSPFEQLEVAHHRLSEAIGRVIVGQERVVSLMLTALFADGHCLFVGVPGLAKTLLVQTVASAVGVNSGRIQFTPDLMPSDITGVEVMDEDPATGKRSFRFVEGPVFTHLLLADEQGPAVRADGDECGGPLPRQLLVKCLRYGRGPLPC